MRDPKEVLLRPVISEKSMGLLEENKYTFYVDPRANKLEIKNAVQQLFDVKVLNVNTMNVKGKPKRVGRFMGKTADRKKAIVTLQDGDRIEIFEGV